MLELDPQTTALVLIDIQKGIMARDLGPHTSAEVIGVCHRLVREFRQAGAPVVLVNVGFARDFRDALRQPVDQPASPPPGGYPANFSELVDGLAEPGDIRITKRQWGAFHGTELDLQLRRRGIQTMVLGGVATNMGVESTARQAWEHGYAVVLVEDASSGLYAEAHDFTIRHIYPRLSRVIRSTDIAFRKG